jgi:hypothetical protein
VSKQVHFVRHYNITDDDITLVASSLYQITNGTITFEACIKLAMSLLIVEKLPITSENVASHL